LEDALKLLGFAMPFAYAAATFRAFHYLDNNVSDEAKTAISGWLQPKQYDKAVVAHAMVAIFDRVYARPLLSWRALFRSAAFTLIIMTIFLYEVGILGEISNLQEEVSRLSRLNGLTPGTLRDFACS
jgi:hypothetical protein